MSHLWYLSHYTTFFQFCNRQNAQSFADFLYKITKKVPLLGFYPLKREEYTSDEISDCYILRYNCQKYKDSIRACLQENLISFDTPLYITNRNVGFAYKKIYYLLHAKNMSKQPYFAKNERIASIFARIAKSAAVTGSCAMGVKYFWHPHHFIMR